MSEQLLTILKLCLLALLYLFFFRVVRAVWAEMRSAAAAPAGAVPAPARPAPAPAPAAPPKRKAARGVPTELVATDPPERRGATFPIGTELTVGRAGGCAISLPDDTYVSNLHARVFTSNGRVLVEDLGSTNGTFLNREKLTATVQLERGDRLQVGSTVLEAK
jgi:pSer/pThr/pTyr-binding forkhead associated (FHA) protein